ncbi:MAG: FAD-dependent oxidoreductase [Gammaproteobacteria bacterium]|nr:FAD-dependent oxidoreductase [Gammaproteobacteria bacterium]
MGEAAPIIVVGGGWSGLACAVELTRLGHRVELLESARQLGGRARRVAFGPRNVDNGQHILLGAYHQTLHLLNSIGLEFTTVLARLPLDLYLQGQPPDFFRLTVPPLPAPLHLTIGLLTAQGVSLRDRFKALGFGYRLWRGRLALEEDIAVLDLLRQQNQSPALIRYLWEPLCLAALNTPITVASAQVFLQVLHAAFCESQLDSHLLLPKTNLSEVLPDQARYYIETHGGQVSLAQRVDSLVIKNRSVEAVNCAATARLAQHVVLALPPHGLIPLISSTPELHDIMSLLAGFSYEPICTVYVQYPDSISTDYPLQGFIGTTMQWIIDRQITSNPGLMAVVISGPGIHQPWDHDHLAKHIVSELKQAFPHWPAPEETLVICEKRATFSCRVAINAIRPDNATPIRGLWLAGDFTRTGYPATLESAVHSGIRCAQLIRETILTQAYYS